VAQARAAAPKMRIYCELTHTAMSWPSGPKNEHNYRRNTRDILETTARIAYARGADGISLFNFFYYRYYTDGVRKSGPFNEPPFDYLTKLADPKALEDDPSFFYLWTFSMKIPQARRSEQFSMDISPARGNGPAALRLLVLSEKEHRFYEGQAAEKIDRGQWDVQLNGVTLEKSVAPQPDYPFDKGPIKAGFNQPQQYVAFRVPAGLLKDGENDVTVVNEALGQPMRLRWIEISQQPTKTQDE